MRKYIFSLGKASYFSSHGHESALKRFREIHTASSYFLVLSSLSSQPICTSLHSLQFQSTYSNFPQLYNYVIKHKELLNMRARRELLCHIVQGCKLGFISHTNSNQSKEITRKSWVEKVVILCAKSVEKSE